MAAKKFAKRSRPGFTLIEVMLALIVFLMMTLMFAAVFPIAIRASHYSNYYAQAALLAQHKLDQVRSAGYSKLDYADLSNLGVVDSNASATGPVYSFTTVDSLDSFFPAGSTGAMVVRDYNALGNVPHPPPAGNVTVVTVTISWKAAGCAQGTYTTSAMIVAMIHR